MNNVNVSDLEVVTIRTTAPIPTDIIRRKFKENIEFIVDYSESRFKGKVFITYLSNLDINVRINLPNVEETLELVSAYLSYPKVTNLPDLEMIAINLLLAYRGKPNFLSFDPTDFIKSHEEILSTWNRRICQLPVFALYARGGEYKAHAEGYPLDEDVSMAGINYVKLIEQPLFSILIDDIKDEELTYNPMLFTSYFFTGANLFNYFASPNNPMFFVVTATPEELEAAQAIGISELNELQQYLGDQNVPLI